MQQSYKNKNTGESHSLKHLQSFTATYSIKTDEGYLTVPVRVFFSNHCWTRSLDEDKDPQDIDIVCVEERRFGKDSRVFCKERYNFSKKLPAIIEDLHGKGCFQAHNGYMLYRQEDSPHPGSHEGWYIYAKLGHDNRYKNLTLNIRSVHYRTNRPESIGRGGIKRFYIWLSRYYSHNKHKIKLG